MVRGKQTTPFTNTNNQKIAEKLISHLELGKTIGGKGRAAISKKTASKYFTSLRIISDMVGKDFDKLEQNDIDTFRINMKANKHYKPSTKRDIEYKALGVLLKYLGKANLIDYSDNWKREISEEIDVLSREEIDSLVNGSELRDKVIFMLLYDSGARLEEFSNLLFSDIDDSLRKDKGYYKIRLRVSKTIPRTVSVPMCTDILDNWIKKNKTKIGTKAKLVDLSYGGIHDLVRRKGKEILKKRVYPHLFRHSSATYYCGKLSHYQLCKRYGWSMASDMPKIYISRTGVEEEETTDRIVGDDNIALKKQIQELLESNRLLSSKVEGLSSKESKDVVKVIDVKAEMENKYKALADEMKRMSIQLAKQESEEALTFKDRPKITKQSKSEYLEEKAKKIREGIEKRRK